jgi:hypothetical protein
MAEAAESLNKTLGEETGANRSEESGEPGRAWLKVTISLLEGVEHDLGEQDPKNTILSIKQILAERTDLRVGGQELYIIDDMRAGNDQGSELGNQLTLATAAEWASSPTLLKLAVVGSSYDLMFRIKLLENMHLKGLMYQDNETYAWELVIQTLNEVTGEFAGYNAYPTLHPIARLHCTGKFHHAGDSHAESGGKIEREDESEIRGDSDGAGSDEDGGNAEGEGVGNDGGNAEGEGVGEGEGEHAPEADEGSSAEAALLHNNQLGQLDASADALGIVAPPTILSDFVGRLVFREGRFLPDYRPTGSHGLVEDGTNGEIDLFLVPPGGMVKLSETATSKNNTPKDILNAVGVWWADERFGLGDTRWNCFFNDGGLHPVEL